MYLRYREPVWEASEAVDGAPTRGSESNGVARGRLSSAGHGPGARPASRASSAGGSAAPLPMIVLHGVKLHAVTERQVIDHILDALDDGRGGVVVTPNLDHLRRYCHDLSFGAVISEADLVVADGMPLVWASRLQGTPLPERVPGSNLISTLSSVAGERGRSVFLLGGDPGTAQGATQALQQKYPHVKIAGYHFPPFGFQDDPAEMSRIIQALSDARPDIVFVALGSPKQEKLIGRLRPILPNAWWLGVGNSFSFLAGHVKRAPLWMQRIGAEWVHRLAQEPRRLFRRYLILGVPFATSMLSRAAVRGVPNRIRRLRRGAAGADFIPLRTSADAGRHSPEQLVAAEAALARAAVAQPGESLEPVAPPAIVPAPRAADPSALARLRAMVLLGGSVRASALASSVQRSVLDLPLDDRGSILNHWLDHAAQVTHWAGIERLPVRVMVNQTAPDPRSAEARHFGHFRVERDLSEYRGTGGLLRDLAADYDDDDLILVANAAQVLLDPLASIAAALHGKGGDVSIVSHEDGTPSGMMLITCKVLRLIAPRGFVDMKEQALPLIASRYDVRVLHRRRPTGLPVRSLADYIQALRYHHRRRGGGPAGHDPLAEDWSPTFSIVEDGASVDASARVHDSVVLRGAIVEPGAVLVRSVVCPGSIVYRDRTAVDELVCGGVMGASSSSGGAGSAGRRMGRKRRAAIAITPPAVPAARPVAQTR